MEIIVLGGTWSHYPRDYQESAAEGDGGVAERFGIKFPFCLLPCQFIFRCAFSFSIDCMTACFDLL